MNKITEKRWWIYFYNNAKFWPEGPFSDDSDQIILWVLWGDHYGQAWLNQIKDFMKDLITPLP